MSGTEAFFDTNVLLYLVSPDGTKAGLADAAIRRGGIISVQVLNEFAYVAMRKFHAPWPVIHELLAAIRSKLEVEDVTLEIHGLGLRIAERYRFRVYDSLLLAAALIGGCKTFYSEDLQHGQVIENTLTIRNPFLAS